jgi:uncharacterized protein YqgC (DUF456 family)
MTWLLYGLGALCLALGVAGVVLPLLPGSLLLLGGAVLVAWAEGFTRVGWPTLALAAALAALIWAVDWVAAAAGAKATGASRWAVLGASVGVVVGLAFGPLGLLLGPAVGAVAFEYWKNPDFERALRAGAGAFVGFILGGAVKVALALVLVGAVVLALAV